MSSTARIILVALAFVGGLALVLRVAAPPAAVAPVREAGDAGPAATPEGADDARGFVGVLIADEVADVAARTDGAVISVQVRLGDRVASGSVIATIDDGPLRDELAMARASLASALAREQQSRLARDEARERRERWHAINTDGGPRVVSEEELSSLSYKEKYAAQQLDAALADAAEARARVQSLERRLSETVVRAPFDGRVALRYVDSGATVRVGEPIVRLVREGEPWVRFAVPEERAATLAIRTEVEVRVESVDLVLGGVVEKVAPEVDAASGMIVAEARLTVGPELADRALAGRVARVYLRANGQAATP